MYMSTYKIVSTQNKEKCSSIKSLTICFELHLVVHNSNMTSSLAFKNCSTPSKNALECVKISRIL